MIVVNVSQSYAELLRKERPMLFIEFSKITTGHWPPMSDSTLEGFTDFLVGTYNDMVVTAFKILSTKRVEVESREKLEFVVDNCFNPERPLDAFNLNQRVDPAAWLIGCPIPGGPWKRGEARGTRRYSLDAYLKDNPDLAVRRDEDFPAAMAENLFAYFQGDARVPVEDFPALELTSGPLVSAPPTGGVTITRQPDGTVVIVIPTGTKAHLTLDPEQLLGPGPTKPLY